MAKRSSQDAAPRSRSWVRAASRPHRSSRLDHPAARLGGRTRRAPRGRRSATAAPAGTRCSGRGPAGRRGRARRRCCLRCRLPRASSTTTGASPKSMTQRDGRIRDHPKVDDVRRTLAETGHADARQRGRVATGRRCPTLRRRRGPTPIARLHATSRRAQRRRDIRPQTRSGPGRMLIGRAIHPGRTARHALSD